MPPAKDKRVIESGPRRLRKVHASQNTSNLIHVTAPNEEHGNRRIHIP
jgi:hypothetical protein